MMISIIKSWERDVGYLLNISGMLSTTHAQWLLRTTGTHVSQYVSDANSLKPPTTLPFLHILHGAVGQVTQQELSPEVS